jgi:hypothetical protein
MLLVNHAVSLKTWRSFSSPRRMPARWHRRPRSTPFRMSGKQFALELSRSDKLGPLQQNELVISRAP